MNSKKTFGHELRRLREVAGLTMRDLAQSLGCSIVYISDIERSRRNPPDSGSIRKLLIRLGKIDAMPEMTRLAAEARKSIVFEVLDGDSRDNLNFLLAFKRRIDQGGVPPDVVKRLMDILGEDYINE